MANAKAAAWHRVGPVGWQRIWRTLYTIAMLSALGLTQCTHAVRTSVLVPAAAHDVAKLRRFAVMPFTGPAGASLSSDIEHMLVNTMLDGEPYFVVVERASFDTILREISLTRAGLFDEHTAVRVGKQIGAAAIIVGAVTTHAVEDRRYLEERWRCVDDGCKEHETYHARCIERNAYVAATPKVVHVETGRIVAAETFSSVHTHKACRGDKTSLLGRVELLTEAREDIVKQFRQLVAPRYVTVWLRMLTKDNTSFAPVVKRMVKEGVTWAKNGRLDRTCATWLEAHRRHARGYAIPYNLGVCAEASGDWRQALYWYQEADLQTGKPVRLINNALGRVNECLRQQRQLAEQLPPSQVSEHMEVSFTTLSVPSTILSYRRG